MHDQHMTNKCNPLLVKKDSFFFCLISVGRRVWFQPPCGHSVVIGEHWRGSTGSNGVDGASTDEKHLKQLELK